MNYNNADNSGDAFIAIGNSGDVAGYSTDFYRGWYGYTSLGRNIAYQFKPNNIVATTSLIEEQHIKSINFIPNYSDEVMVNGDGSDSDNLIVSLVHQLIKFDIKYDDFRVKEYLNVSFFIPVSSPKIFQKNETKLIWAVMYNYITYFLASLRNKPLSAFISDPLNVRWALSITSVMVVNINMLISQSILTDSNGNQYSSLCGKRTNIQYLIDVYLYANYNFRSIINDAGTVPYDLLDEIISDAYKLKYLIFSGFSNEELQLWDNAFSDKTSILHASFDKLGTFAHGVYEIYNNGISGTSKVVGNLLLNNPALFNPTVQYYNKLDKDMVSFYPYVFSLYQDKFDNWGVSSADPSFATQLSKISAINENINAIPNLSLVDKMLFVNATTFSFEYTLQTETKYTSQWTNNGFGPGTYVKNFWFGPSDDHSDNPQNISTSYTISSNNSVVYSGNKITPINMNGYGSQENTDRYSSIGLIVQTDPTGPGVYPTAELLDRSNLSSLYTVYGRLIRQSIGLLNWTLPFKVSLPDPIITEIDNVNNRGWYTYNFGYYYGEDIGANTQAFTLPHDYDLVSGTVLGFGANDRSLVHVYVYTDTWYNIPHDAGGPGSTIPGVVLDNDDPSYISSKHILFINSVYNQTVDPLSIGVHTASVHMNMGFKVNSGFKSWNIIAANGNSQVGDQTYLYVSPFASKPLGIQSLLPFNPITFQLFQDVSTANSLDYFSPFTSLSDYYDGADEAGELAVTLNKSIIDPDVLNLLVIYDMEFISIPQSYFDSIVGDFPFDVVGGYDPITGEYAPYESQYWLYDISSKTYKVYSTALLSPDFNETAKGILYAYISDDSMTTNQLAVLFSNIQSPTTAISSKITSALSSNVNIQPDLQNKPEDISVKTNPRLSFMDRVRTMTSNVSSFTTYDAPDNIRIRISNYLNNTTDSLTGLANFLKFLIIDIPLKIASYSKFFLLGLTRIVFNIIIKVLSAAVHLAYRIISILTSLLLKGIDLFFIPDKHNNFHLHDRYTPMHTPALIVSSRIFPTESRLDKLFSIIPPFTYIMFNGLYALKLPDFSTVDSNGNYEYNIYYNITASQRVSAMYNVYSAPSSQANFYTNITNNAAVYGLHTTPLSTWTDTSKTYMPLSNGISASIGGLVMRSGRKARSGVITGIGAGIFGAAMLSQTVFSVSQKLLMPDDWFDFIFSTDQASYTNSINLGALTYINNIPEDKFLLELSSLEDLYNTNSSLYFDYDPEPSYDFTLGKSFGDGLNLANTIGFLGGIGLSLAVKFGFQYIYNWARTYHKSQKYIVDPLSNTIEKKLKRNNSVLTDDIFSHDDQNTDFVVNKIDSVKGQITNQNNRTQDAMKFGVASQKSLNNGSVNGEKPSTKRRKP